VLGLALVGLTAIQVAIPGFLGVLGVLDGGNRGQIELILLGVNLFAGVAIAFSAARLLGYWEISADAVTYHAARPIELRFKDIERAIVVDLPQGGEGLRITSSRGPDRLLPFSGFESGDIAAVRERLRSSVRTDEERARSPK